MIAPALTVGAKGHHGRQSAHDALPAEDLPCLAEQQPADDHPGPGRYHAEDEVEYPVHHFGFNLLLMKVWATTPAASPARRQAPIGMDRCRWPSPLRRQRPPGQCQRPLEWTTLVPAPALQQCWWRQMHPWPKGRPRQRAGWPAPPSRGHRSCPADELRRHGIVVSGVELLEKRRGREARDLRAADADVIGDRHERTELVVGKLNLDQAARRLWQRPPGAP
ncbi:hypothetical protein ABIB57_004319 [Devosia sp. UYZn731]